MVAGGVPTVQLLLDDGSGTFPYDITSFWRSADGYDVSRGREDEVSDISPGQLKLTLDNTDGRFTVGSTTLGSPSPIVADQKIRLKVTANATTVNRFTGYVQQWPVTWPSGSDLFSTVQILATDAQARAERRVLRSVVEEEIMADSPQFLATLGEPAGATSAADTSGTQQTSLTLTGPATPAVVFGSATGPADDGLTGATFNNGQYLSTVLNFGSTPTTVGIGFYFTTSTSATPILRLSPATGAASNTPIIETSGTGKLGITDGTVLAQSTATAADGALHHGFFVLTTTAATVYLDGVTAGSVAITNTFSSSMLLEVGGANFTPNVTYPSFSPGTSGMVGSLEHVTIFTTPPSAGRIAQQSSAGLTGFVGETDNARLTRIAGYAGITTGTLDTSLSNATVADFTGNNNSAADALRDVADASMGLAFINGSGTLDFHNRQKVTTKSTFDLTIDANQLAEDTAFFYDTQGLVNYFETTAAATGVAQVVRNTASETSHGRYTSSKTYLVQTDGEALDRANWIVKTHAQPAPRVGTLVVDLLTMTAANQAAWLAVEADHWIRVTGLPSQTPGGTTADLVVQGIADSLQAGPSGSEWNLTLNVVSKTTVFPKVFILDASVLDGPDLLGV